MNSLQEAIESMSGMRADGHPVENQEAVINLLQTRKFTPKVAPPPFRSVYELAGHIICTPGNLSSITAGIKTGKTAVIGAMAASVMATDNTHDLLGFTSRNPHEFALLHFDSEQSPWDHWCQMDRALKRAGVEDAPGWLHSYCLTGLDHHRAWECVEEAVGQAASQHGGIHSILIDGVADFVMDVNSPGESNEFVARLQERAIQHDCPIIGVIHFNPGGNKVRGHLGSQLERKAETNLRLDKEDEVTTIWSDKQRRAPIPKDGGPCFRWDDTKGMHVSTATLGAVREEEEMAELLALAGDIFGEHTNMRYREIVSALLTKHKLKQRTAERRVKRMSELGVLKKGDQNLYTRNT